MEQPYLRGLSGWRPLARGGFAFVWEALQLALDRPVAVKVYRPGSADGDRRGFPREAAAAARLSGHPGIVTVYDAGILNDERPYLIMELCSAGSLARWLKPGRLPAHEQVRQAGIQVADALAAVHARGLLHCDIKPANILIDGYDNPRLSDFGSAVATGDGKAPSGALRITPAYAPLEAFGTDPATSSGDVFSLAATIYALLAGYPPRGSDTTGFVTLDQMIEAAKRPISPIPDVDPFLMGVLMTALDRDPTARPTAAMFRDQLAAVAEHRRPIGRSLVGTVNDKLPMLAGRRRDVGVRSAAARDHSAVPTSATAPRRAADPSETVQAPGSGGKRSAGILLLAALAAVVASSTAWLAMVPGPPGSDSAMTQSVTRGDGPATLAPPPTADGRRQTAAHPERAADVASSAWADRAGVIWVDDSEVVAKPFQPVRIDGTYRGGADATLQVQRLEEGKWLAFPIPTTTDEAGRFTAYVELGRQNQYLLRVLNPESGVNSKPFELVIRG